MGFAHYLFRARNVAVIAVTCPTAETCHMDESQPEGLGVVMPMLAGSNDVGTFLSPALCRNFLFLEQRLKR